MKNRDVSGTNPGKTPGKIKEQSKIKEQKKSFFVRYFEWIAKGTQKANEQGRGPCRY